MSDKKTEAEILHDKLLYKKKNGFEALAADEGRKIFDYAKGYSEYLAVSKTEREAVRRSVAMLTTAGYKPYTIGDRLEKGGKYYLNNRAKSLFAFTVGSADINDGVRVCAAHIDSPRLDFKQHPLFETEGMSYFKTHYYGGLRKYQWVTVPLAIHGVVTKRGGETVEVNLGEDDGDPVFVITDLLPHLGREQGKSTLNAAFGGEVLNILIGATPLYEDGKVSTVDDKVKLNMMRLLNEKYGICEEDFMSAELCAVPAGKPCDIGLDRLFIGAYGHDDKVCAYPALTALIDTGCTEHTNICVLADKEEIGSDGISGMKCSLLAELIDEIARTLGGNPVLCRHNSKCLSADVNAAFDPNYPDVFEKNNSSLANCGVAMSKYTGSGGKYDTNDASSEFVGFVRDLFDDNSVMWQTGELGKIDAGGGGTVAKYIANHNIETVDIGVPVLSMHAPFEQISKIDLYEAYKAFVAFCK